MPGCVVVRGDGSDPPISIPVWPEGYTVRETGTSVEVVDDSGTRVARIGDMVGLGGGPISQGYARRLSDGEVPAVCFANQYFEVNSVVR